MRPTTVFAHHDGTAYIPIHRATNHTQAAAPPGTEVPHEYDRELHVCALDLVSGLAEALGPSIDPLVGPSGLMQVSLS